MNDFDAMMDRALDAAEAKIESPETPVVLETEATQSEAQESPQELPQETVAIKEALESKSSKQSKPRDPKGKFTKEAAAPETAAPEEQASDQVVNDEPSPTEEAQSEEPVADTGIAPPAFWSTEQKALFAKAPRELQETIAARELTLQQQLSRATNEAHEAKGYKQRLAEVFEPHRLKYTAQGLKDPVEVTERLLAWNETFEKDAQLGIIDLMHKNRLTPEMIAQRFYGYAESQPQEDPRLQQALSKAEELERKFEESQQLAVQQRLNSELEEFKQGKDAYGQQRKAFVELYEPQIADFAKQIRAVRPELSNQQLLNEAYNGVLEAVRKAHGITSVAKPAPKPQQVVANAQKAKAAAGSVSGAPASGVVNQRPRLKGNTFEEKLASALGNAEQRVYEG